MLADTVCEANSNRMFTVKWNLKSLRLKVSPEQSHHYLSIFICINGKGFNFLGYEFIAWRYRRLNQWIQMRMRSYMEKTYSLLWGNNNDKLFTGGPYVQFDKGSQLLKAGPTLVSSLECTAYQFAFKLDIYAWFTYNLTRQNTYTLYK